MKKISSLRTVNDTVMHCLFSLPFAFSFMLTTFTSRATKILHPWKNKLCAEQKNAHQRWI